MSVVQRNPMRRLATPDEIARVVAFISSPAASFVSGANWYVDGGSTSHVQILNIYLMCLNRRSG